jgi:hypothetical protein
METISTLKSTLEWQAMNEIAETLEASNTLSEPGSMANAETVRRTFVPRDSRSNKPPRKNVQKAIYLFIIFIYLT